jgi:tetratricopeptide (TPR) repeat protein
MSFSAELTHGKTTPITAPILKKENDIKLLQHYELELEKDPNNFKTLINAAYLQLRLGWLYSNKEEAKKHYRMLQKYANRALKINPSNYDAQLLDIIAKGKTIDYLSVGDQVHRVWQLKKDLDTLIANHGDDPNAIYVLSWLNFKVGQVNSLQKFVASFFFGGLPDDLTTQNALNLMKKAISLRPNYCIYYYDLGLFNQRLGEVEKAKELFEKTVSIPPQKPEEMIYQQWAEQHLQELRLKNLAKN